jgi:hypothetical protein
MIVTLRTIGAGIHAVFYKDGVRIADEDMGDTIEVRTPTPEEAKDQPLTRPDYVYSSSDAPQLSFTGYFVVPGVGPRSGLAAIFGAKQPEE